MTLLNSRQLIVIALIATTVGLCRVGFAEEADSATAAESKSESVSDPEAVSAEEAKMQAKPPPAPAREVKPKIKIQAMWDKTPEARTWTKATILALKDHGEHLLERVPKDIKEYCPKFPKLSADERIAFWVHFVSNLVYFESTFQAETTYVENFKGDDGENVVSRGLLQLSYEDVDRYDCVMHKESLADPVLNLSCGVRVMNHLVRQDGLIARNAGDHWEGLARYWAPLRKAERRETIKEASRRIQVCAN